MRPILFVLLASLSLASWSQSVVTNLVRLPIFCDVAGNYKGTSTDGSTWVATIDPYTGIANVHVQSSDNATFWNGSVHRYKGAVLFSVDLPNGAAWRGKFIFSKDNVPTVSGKFLSFETDGTFNAGRENYPNATCDAYMH